MHLENKMTSWNIEMSFFEGWKNEGANGLCARALNACSCKELCKLLAWMIGLYMKLICLLFNHDITLSRKKRLMFFFKLLWSLNCHNGYMASTWKDCWKKVTVRLISMGSYLHNFFTFSLHACVVIIIWFLSCEPYECCCSWAVIVRRQTLLKSNLLLLGGCVAAMGFGKRVNSRLFICFFCKARFRIWVIDRAIICMNAWDIQCKIYN